MGQAIEGAELQLLVTTPGVMPAFESSLAGVTVARLEQLPKLGDDTQFHGGDAQLARRLLSEARRQTPPCALRIEVRADTLSAAHRRAADVLDALSVQLVAAAAGAGQAPTLLESCLTIDLFSMDARPLQAAARRFRQGPLTAWMWAGVRPRADKRFDMETFGLRKLGLREVHVPAVSEAHVAHVSRFLNLLLVYADRSGRRVEPGDTTAFGWVDVRLLAAEERPEFPNKAALCAPRFLRETCADAAALPGVMVVFEPVDDAPDAALKSGMERATRIVEQLGGAARQCGFEVGIDVPRAASSAVVCTRVLADGAPVEARRVAADEPGSSGWVAVCLDPNHDHEQAESFRRVPLQALAMAAPRLFSMLAAPPGAGLVVRENGEMTVLLPDGTGPG